MKKNFLLTAAGCLLVATSYAQTPEEKRTITNSYNQDKVESVQQFLSNKVDAEKRLVDDFIKLNNVPRKYTSPDGQVFEIRRIVNNQPIYLSTDNFSSAYSSRTNYLHNGGGLGLDIEGQNMDIGVWDQGLVLTSHQEFLNQSASATRVTVGDASTEINDHGTHVGGTMVARGAEASSKGMAPQASLVTYDWSSDEPEAFTEAANNGLLLSNHSYGIPVDQGGGNLAPTWMMGCYDSDAQSWDIIAYNAPYYLPVVSAGNDGAVFYAGGLANGYDKLIGNKNAKNNLVVANASNPSVNSSGELQSLSINASSSQGPSDDGRVKPDIAADGTSVYSAASSGDSDYGVKSGTSMAAPTTSGTLLLLQQYYNELNSSYMRSSTLKGLVCHTADDDNISIGPDPIYGWGLLNAKAAAETIQKATVNQAILVESAIGGGNSTYSVDVNVSSAGPLSATICWTDVEGTDNSNLVNEATPVLVNDLDIRIENDSETFFPWKLDATNVVAAATKGDNIVDNVEKIDIDVPAPGVYTITVSYKGLFLINGDQPFALIVTGSDMTLGSEDVIVEESVRVWPNPVEDVLNINFKSNSSKSDISLVDIHGRRVYHNTISNSNAMVEYSINTKQFSDGVYFLTIKNGTNSLNKKIILN